MFFSTFAGYVRPVSSTPAILAFLLTAWLLQPAMAGEMILSGVYRGKNLFVQNPFSPDNQNYCVEEVFINEVKKMSGIRQSAFEIDLSHLEMQDEVTVRIMYKDGCVPKIINPQALRPSDSFQFGNVTVNQKSLDWTTIGETPGYIYYAEQFVNGSWLPIKRLEAKNTGGGIYSLPVTHYKGENKYRVKAQNNETHNILYSRVATFDPKEDLITFYPKNVASKITLSRAAVYEISDVKGKLIKKGKGAEITLADLKTGMYYLKINNRTEKFFKK